MKSKMIGGPYIYKGHAVEAGKIVKYRFGGMVSVRKQGNYYYLYGKGQPKVVYKMGR